MNEDEYTLKSGFLNVGNGHKLYYQLWGSPHAKPILVPHGGPGSNAKDKHKNLFDPVRHQVIFFDQRGCGKSTAANPFSHNTTQDTVDDMEKLVRHLKFERVHILGYSWGSTLALYFSIQYPQMVDKLLLGGIYLGSKEENQYLFNGGFKNFATEAWDWYLQPIPESKRNDCLKFYADKLLSPKIPEKEKIALLQHFTIMESALVSTDNDFVTNLIEAKSITSLENQTGALIGLHYFKNNCFIPEGYFEENLKKLAMIETIIVQGNIDFVCQPHIASYVAGQIGSNCHLHFVPTSHAGNGAMRETQRAYIWSELV
jgi:proline iminopeptidase